MGEQRPHREGLKGDLKCWSGYVPEIDDFRVRAAPQHTNERFRALEAATDDGQLGQPTEALKRAQGRVVQKVVVQVQSAQVRYERGQSLREGSEPTCGELEVDEVVAWLRDEPGLEGIA